MARYRLWIAGAVLVVAASLTAGCCAIRPPSSSPAAEQAEEPAPSRTPAPTATVAPTDTPTPLPTDTPAPTPEPTDDPGELPALPEVDVGAITSTLDGGWVLYELPADGFSIALPPGWLPVGVSAEGIAAMLKVVGEQNPQLGSFLSNQAFNELAAQGLVFYALDADPDLLKSGMPATINVLKLDTGIELPLDVITPLTVGQLEEIALPDVPLTSERIDLGGIEADTIRYATEVAGVAGGLQQVAITQLIVPFGGGLYILSLGAPLELSPDLQGVLDEIGGSFRLFE